MPMFSTARISLLASNSSFFSILINLSSFSRSSHRRFTGKHLCWSLFVIELQVFRAATLLKEIILQIFKFFKYFSILKNSYEKLLLILILSCQSTVFLAWDLSKYSILSLRSEITKIEQSLFWNLRKNWFTRAFLFKVLNNQNSLGWLVFVCGGGDYSDRIK